MASPGRRFESPAVGGACAIRALRDWRLGIVSERLETRRFSVANVRYIRYVRYILDTLDTLDAFSLLAAPARPGLSLRHSRLEIRRPASLSCCRPWVGSAVAAAWRALSWRPGNYPPTAARPPPCSIGYPAHHDLQTCAPSLSTVVRDADTLLPCSPRSRCPFVR